MNTSHLIEDISLEKLVEIFPEQLMTVKPKYYYMQLHEELDGWLSKVHNAELYSSWHDSNDRHYYTLEFKSYEQMVNFKIKYL